ncbi:MAG: ABC transporter substrate-binding protein [Actinomycetota bacterium]|nr:ABC transporter substrate-binding protein [Actinomycetota bacterium]
MVTKRTSTWRRLSIPVLGLALFAASACTATPAQQAAQGGGGGQSGSSAPQPASVLTLQGDSTKTQDFNPLSGTGQNQNFLIYEPLVFISPIDSTPTAFLAAKFSKVSASDLEVTVRDGVKWSDGKPFTAADVVFTFNLLKKFPAVDIKGVWAFLKSVTASGSKVSFTLKQPSLPFMDTILSVPIVSEHQWSAVPDPAKYADAKPIGTGPYVVKSYTPSEIKLAKNPSYWQANKVAADEIDYPVGATAASASALQVTSGTYDWVYSFLPDVQKTYIDPDPKNRTYYFPPGGVIALYLNLTKKPYSNVDFRKGVSLSLNRSSIARKAVNGYLDQASTTGLILPNLKKYLDPSIPNQGMVSQNKDAALAAFGKAGYTMKGDKLTGADGSQAAFTMLVPNGFTDWQQAAVEVQQELAAVGIAVKIDNPQYAQYSKTIGSGDFDAAFGGFGGSGNAYTDYNNALNSAFAAPIGTQTVNNFERFKDPSVDKALQTLATSTDNKAQLTATYSLEKIMMEQVPIVPMYYGGSWGLFKIDKFTGWPSAKDPYTLPTTYNNSLLKVLTTITKVK